MLENIPTFVESELQKLMDRAVYDPPNSVMARQNNRLVALKIMSTLNEAEFSALAQIFHDELSSVQRTQKVRLFMASPISVVVSFNDYFDKYLKIVGREEKSLGEILADALGVDVEDL